MKKLIIEVAINEYVTRDKHPDVPLTAEEIAEQAAECADAGATIIHFHPRHAEPGRSPDSLAEDVESYIEIMQAIAERCDVITHPTYTDPSFLPPTEAFDADAPAFPHVRVLRERGPVPLETFVPFIGATNFGRWSDEQGAWVADTVTEISHQKMAEFLSWCRGSGLRVKFGVREIGHLRHIELYRELGLVEPPINLQIGMSSSHPWGLPADAKGLMTLLSFIPAQWDAEWFIQYNLDMGHASSSDEDRHRLLNVLAICAGGHVRTGLGNHPSWGSPPLRSVEMVQRFVEVAETVGREIATTAEAREMLGLDKPTRLCP